MVKIKNSYKRIDKRGVFIEYFNDDQAWRSVNGGTMKKGAVMGNHYHKKARTLFYILSGSAVVVAKNIKKTGAKIQKIYLKNSEGAVIEKYETHAWKFLEKSDFLLLKSEKFSEGAKDIFPGKVMKGK